MDRIRCDPSAFSELFHLYYNPIFGYIFRRTGIFDDAADIAATSFLNAFKNIHRFDYRGISIKVWLYRIATNELNLYFRHRKKYRSLFDSYSFEDRNIFSHHYHEDKKVLEEELLRHRQFSDVLRGLKELPLKYQDVLSLRYFEGKGIREISVILGIKEGTVKSLLSRGIDKLRIKCNPGPLNDLQI